jgi:RNA polymerase sigma-70 factor, ECF subfamily
LPQLSPEHREVIEKVILQGLSYRDAAEALNIPDGTLRTRLIAAKRVLADLVKARLPPSQRGCR